MLCVEQGVCVAPDTDTLGSSRDVVYLFFPRINVDSLLVLRFLVKLYLFFFFKLDFHLNKGFLFFDKSFLVLTFLLPAPFWTGSLEVFFSRITSELWFIFILTRKAEMF